MLDREPRGDGSVGSVEEPLREPRVEAPAGSADPWTDLESVLDNFEERRAGDLATRREAEAREAAFRTGCVDVLTEIVLPTFESAAQSLAKRAHECMVAKRIADYDVPSADLTIRPHVPQERWVRRSRLSMRCLSTEGFVVFGEIAPPRKDPISLTRTYSLGEVDEDLIKTQVIQFVRSVLSEY